MTTTTLAPASSTPHPRSLALLADGLRLADAASRMPADLLAVAVGDQAAELVAASVEARTGRPPESVPWLCPPASLDDARVAVRARVAELVKRLHARTAMPPVRDVEALHHALMDLALLLDARILVVRSRSTG